MKIMKSTYLLLSASLMLSVFSCDKAVQQEESDKKEVVSTSTEEMLLPRNLISVEAAKEQLKYFQDAHPGVNGDEYALRSWISLEDLENYIAYARKQAQEKDIAINGIEFIFSQYKAAEPNLPNLSNKDYGLTFMYAPTYHDGNRNVGFDPLLSQKGKLVKIEELLSRKIDAVDEIDTAEKSPKPSGIGNYINSCPEICN